MDWALRLAREDDIPALESLIEQSVRELQSPFYSPAQMDGALGTVFGVDRQLIRDKTYFVIEQERALLACGGWSKRESLFGSDAARERDDALLDHAATQRASALSSSIRATPAAVSAARFLSRAKKPSGRRVSAESSWWPRSPASISISRRATRKASVTKSRS